MDPLVRIKKCALADDLVFTAKARDEMERDDLSPDDVRESLLSAVAIYKTIRSKHPATDKREYLYIIRSATFTGVAIYSKGKIVMSGGNPTFYVLISSKMAL